MRSGEGTGFAKGPAKLTDAQWKHLIEKHLTIVFDEANSAVRLGYARDCLVKEADAVKCNVPHGEKMKVMDSKGKTVPERRFAVPTEDQWTHLKEHLNITFDEAQSEVRLGYDPHCTDEAHCKLPRGGKLSLTAMSCPMSPCHP